MDPQIVDQVRLAGSVAPIDMSIFGLFSHADIIGKSVMVGLIVISVFTWALIIDKINKISRLKHRAEFFEERFWNAGS
jgi:biopolymer transport protein TolQ